MRGLALYFPRALRIETSYTLLCRCVQVSSQCFTAKLKVNFKFYFEHKFREKFRGANPDSNPRPRGSILSFADIRITKEHRVSLCQEYNKTRIKFLFNQLKTHYTRNDSIIEYRYVIVTEYDETGKVNF